MGTGRPGELRLDNESAGILMSSFASWRMPAGETESGKVVRDLQEESWEQPGKPLKERLGVGENPL